MPKHKESSTLRNGNRILAGLSAADRASLEPFLERVRLEPRASFWETGRPIRTVVFPETLVASIIATDEEGGEVEVGTVGYEGVVGLPLFLGATTAPGRAFTQIGGDGSRMDAEAFTRFAASLPEFRTRLQRYTQGFVAQVSQSVACNRLHSPSQRLARWLLSCADRVGADRFPMTQEFLGQMLGVRRATVGEAAQELQERGLIRYTRGVIDVLDRSALEQVACPCYGIVRREYDKLLGTALG
ncbi:MAG TPA: Crp/Fnr family transcriptional regulator [Gemmatimonadales bacterium]|nr:Crp/Fnr family transcriptional regulator [Gemmatimonadales bacterium]